LIKDEPWFSPIAQLAAKDVNDQNMPSKQTSMWESGGLRGEAVSSSRTSGMAETAVFSVKALPLNTFKQKNLWEYRNSEEGPRL